MKGTSGETRNGSSNSSGGTTVFKAIYFTAFAAMGVLGPYLPLFYESLAMTKTQIGALSMVPNFSSFFFAPMWSYLSDNLGLHEETMIISIVASSALFQVMNYLHSFTAVFSVNVLASFFRSPMIPLLDSLVMEALPDKRDYGSYRLWGAVSYGLFALFGGLLTAHGGEHNQAAAFRWIFIISSLTLLCGGFTVLIIVNRSVLKEKRSPSGVKQQQAVAGDGIELTKVTEGASSVSSETTSKTSSNHSHNDNQDKHAGAGADAKLSAWQLMKLIAAQNSGIGVFSVIVLLSGFGSGVIDAFLVLRLKQLGGSGTVMGIGRAITCAAEIPMFQIAGYLHAKYGTWYILAVTQFAFVVRFTYYSLLRSPWWVLPCEALHGLTFATTWSVSCAFASEIAPPGTTATMQALLEGLHFGLGSGCGSLVGGYVYDYFGAVALFEGCAVMCLLGCVLALLKAAEQSLRDPSRTMRRDSSPISAQDPDSISNHDDNDIDSCGPV